MMWRRGILVLWLVSMFLVGCSDQKKPAVDLEDIPWCRIIHPTWEDTIRVNREYDLVMDIGGLTKPAWYGYSHGESIHHSYYWLDDSLDVSRVSLPYSFQDTGVHRIIFRARSDNDEENQVTACIMVNAVE